MTQILSVSSAVPVQHKSTWQKLVNFSSIVCSRESTYRTLLDITAFDIPIMFSDVFRGAKKFLESVFEASLGTIMVLLAPVITSFVGNVVGKSILNETDKKHALKYLCFSMNTLRNIKNEKDIEKRKELVKTAVEKMKKEEVEDKEFISSLYEKSGYQKQVESYKEKIKDIQEFVPLVDLSESNIDNVLRLKKAAILGESLIEGGWWGGFGLLNRLFRKHILQEDRFTGTKNYVSDAESETLGEAGELNLFQKILGGGAIFISPILNKFMLSQADTGNENSWFAKTARNQLDTTHGVYPKLGFLFTITTIPKWLSSIALSQGNLERIERAIKLFTLLPSWWLGHRVTNGVLAKKADERFVKKYNLDPGILVEKEDLKQTFPEPAKIHHILNAVEKSNLDPVTKALAKQEVEEEHAKSLIYGFTLHSVGVWIINMAVNYTTKLRALSALGKN